MDRIGDRIRLRRNQLGFDLSGKWWSIDCLGRTLIIYRGRVLLFSPQ